MLELRTKVLGIEHPATLISMDNLALVLGSQGRYEGAETMHRQILELREKVLGNEHPSTLDSMNNLAEVLDSQGKYRRQKRCIGKPLRGSKRFWARSIPGHSTA
jgi:hypothetical protein